MATRQLNAREARHELGDLVTRAAYAHEHTIIAKYGKPLAALISVEELEILDRFVEEYQDHLDVEAADRVTADENDEIIPFVRTT